MKLNFVGLAIIAAAIAPSPAAAGTTTYTVNDVIGSFTLQGTITTDGTIGAFTLDTRGVDYLDAILAWNLSISDGISSQTLFGSPLGYGSGNSVGVFFPDGWSASVTNLYYDFSSGTSQAIENHDSTLATVIWSSGMYRLELNGVNSYDFSRVGVSVIGSCLAGCPMPPPTPVPAPIAGVGFPGLALGCVSLLGWWRRRRSLGQ